MKTLIINKSLMPRGGSETYIIQIGSCPEQMDRDVQYFGVDEPSHALGNRTNQYTPNMGFHTRDFGCLAHPLRVLYFKEVKQKLMRVLEDLQSDAVHINNFNYQLTPSIPYGIRDHGRRLGKRTAVLYTAHDYQLIRPNHMLSPPGDEQNCELCMDGHYASYVRKRYIHSSMAKSLLGAVEGMVYRRLKACQYIDRVTCPSYFMEEKVNHVDLFRGRTITTHNFAVRGEEVPDVKKDYILRFGRYFKEKGIGTLLRACRELSDTPSIPTGVESPEDRIRGIPNIKSLGLVKGGGLNRLIWEARLGIYPSEYYEDCPSSVIKSQLLRTPILGARIGGIPELTQEGVSGVLLTSGDLGDLKEKIRYLWNRSQLCTQQPNRCRDVLYDAVKTCCNKPLELYGIGRKG